MTRRLSRGSGDEGAYAILYAVLVVVLVALGAVVVDFAQVRQDRRLDRSATDSAVIGGAALLNPAGAASPQQACQQAWRYLGTTLNITLPSNPMPCTPFAGLTNTVCSTTPIVQYEDRRTIGNRTFVIAWPITDTSEFMTPDLSPGAAAQNISAAADGTDPCARLGVAVIEAARFGLGGGIGASGTQTQVHSVARFSLEGGGEDVVAALNILDKHNCNTLRSTGTGQVFVTPFVDRDGSTQPGTIAVESDALRTGPNKGDCGPNDHVINANGSNAKVCANGTVFTNTCDGGGAIYSHALDSGLSAGWAYDNNDVTAGHLNPRPIAEAGTHGYAPVTKLYGCNLTGLPDCQPPASPAPNYVAQLEATMGASSPVPYSASQAPYVNPYPGAFAAVPAGVCANITTLIHLTAANWNANCSIVIKNGGTLIIDGGNLVVNGGIQIQSGGCFVMNSALATCPTSSNVTGTGAAVTLTTPPLNDSIIYLKNGDFVAQGSLAMPQTFVYARGTTSSKGDTPGAINVTGTTFTFWTAPGAGAVDGSGHTRLENACLDGATGKVNQDCLNSRFSRLAFWSDYIGTNTGAHKDTFQGSGGLTVVGVFFTPNSYFNLAGSSSLPIISQFWAQILDVNGGASLPLSPTDRAAIRTPIGSVALIR